MATAAVAAPGVTRVQDYSVGTTIELHRQCMRARRYEPIGQMLNLMLGPDDEAAYMQKKDVRERIARLSQYRGLMLDWGNNGPVIAYAPARSSCLFPLGISKPPRAYDPVPAEKAGKKITQELSDYASGYMLGRDGTEFLILRPVLYIGVWILANLYTMVGQSDPQTGEYPTLLINPKTREGHIIGGLLVLTTAKQPQSNYLPWKDGVK
jgi:hypothetical protein